MESHLSWEQKPTKGCDGIMAFENHWANRYEDSCIKLHSTIQGAEITL